LGVGGGVVLVVGGFFLEKTDLSKKLAVWKKWTLGRDGNPIFRKKRALSRENKKAQIREKQGRFRKLAGKRERSYIGKNRIK